MAATVLVIPQKDTAEGYESEIQLATDGLAAAGFYPQFAATNDLLVGLERDVSGNLVLKDTITGAKTLAELLGGSGVSTYDFLLETDPNYTGFTYVVTYSGVLVSKETWTVTATSKIRKTSDYTYVSGRVVTQIDRIYDTDGTTIVAQTTTNISYSGGKVTGYVRTRDI
jgi:hypothetical protein